MALVCSLMVGWRRLIPVIRAAARTENPGNY
jgi:hypothetical protein